MAYNHISLSHKERYKTNIIPIVSKKAESSKKPRGEPGTLTGVIEAQRFFCFCFEIWRIEILRTQEESFPE